MTNRGPDSERFEALSREFLQSGLAVRFEARGASMSPAIRDGEIVYVTPVIVSKLRKDDIVLTKGHSGFRVHRLVVADLDKNLFITRGDCGVQDDPPLRGEQILGVAVAKEVRIGRKFMQARFKSVGGLALRCAARSQVLAGKAWRSGLFGKNVPARLGLLLFLLAATFASSQVAVNSTTSGSNELTGNGNRTLTIPHTTAGANRLMLVGVSINITRAPATAVVGVTYGATALTLVGAHNDAGNTRRVELWSLLAPATGPASVIVTVNIPAARTEGIAAGVTTFTGVDQSVPLGTFTSADGAAATNSQADVPSVINGMILDTLAIGGDQTAAVSGPQASQWNLNTGANANTDVTAVGSTRTGAQSVPISETFGGASNWSLGAVSINPSTADIGVSTSVSAVALGSNSTYNITITNKGTSAANNVTLTDTFASTGLSVVSVTPSAGTTCTTAATINCTLPTPLASGASATVAVKVATTAAGFYPNTATITDSGTPPDPNTGNNTYVALAPVVSLLCSTGTLAAGGTLTGVVNTYYPGTASVSVGATSIPIGTANGSGTIALGTELLVIQMQDASINVSNTGAYGNGSTGTGFTTINNAGNYEFVTATGPISGGSVPVLGAGVGGGLVFGYTAAAASATKGQSTYQVVIVPQYSTATLGAVTAAPWNGSTGGILALDIANQLTLGGATVHVDGVGFRGGAGMQLTGAAGAANTDYLFASPTAYTGAGVAGADGSKGEGVAGTPEWVESLSTFLQTTAGVGYPSGMAGTDASMAHGAPANAGGGGTDSNPGANDQNAGGGGGSNGGGGGFGGDSWNTNLSSGGEGGSAFPATIDRIALGGGGGAGSRNNSGGDNQASSGAGGGGIVFIRAFSFTGTATITANGANAYNGTANDAGGGGGAGGTIIMLAASGGEGGLTLQANGGTGGNAWAAQAYSLANRHGPGGGGSGGVIFVSGAPAGTSVTGGASGLTLNPGVAYGATSGTAGSSATTANMSQVTGLQSAQACTRLPDVTVVKSHVGAFTRGSTASYTLQVSNVNTVATSGVVTVNDTVPLGLTPTSASGTGWTCSVSGQTLSCTRSDALAGGGSYPPITVNVNVSQSAPATITNTGAIAGGGDISPLNDTATDVASVGSTADLSVTDAASPNPVAAGANITYTQIVTNSGPSAADNATYVATVPANTTFASITAPAGWSCLTPAIGGTGNVVCSNVSMSALTAATFNLVVKVNAGAANGTVITQTVSANSSAADPNALNNTATATTVVGTTAPDLTVTNVASPNPVQAGNNITYTQVVTNTGTTGATTATFTEATPANTTFFSITPPAGWTCLPAPPPVSCQNPSVAGGATGTFTVVYKVTAGTAAGTPITDTVTVNAANQSFGSNSAVATDVVATAAQADLALATAGAPAAVFSGNNITYTQTVTNNGPGAATGAQFTEPIPTNTTFSSVIAPAGWVCTVTTSVTCTDGSSLGSGSSADIIVVVNVAPSIAAGTITATSTVSATTSDPLAANNSTTTTTTVAPVCDLAVTNSGTPSPVAVGGTITYAQVITNSGPSNCSAGTFNEALPANTTFVSVAVVTTGGGTWTCPNASPIACTNPSVPPGSTGTITAKYTVNGGTAAGTIITDTATVATTGRDSNVANNTATSTIAVASGAQADLSVANSGSPNGVTAGNNITYTQSVTNNGPATANAPVFTDALPANTSAVSLTGPLGWTCVFATLTCTDTTTMAAATTANFTFVVKVNNNVASGTTISQTDSVSSSTGDPTNANNSATVNLLVADSADLSVTNSGSPVPVLANTNISYTQVVTNAGPSAATTASFTETTPPNTTFQSITPPAGWTCGTVPAVGGTGTITCTNPSVAPGSGSFSLILKVTGGTAAGTAINDTVSVSSAVADPNAANNSATAADVVALATQADIITTNSASPNPVAAGGNITYTQAVTNNGPAVTTAGMTFTQVTPPNTNFQSITPPAGWTCGTVPAIGGTGTITCTDSGTLGVGSTATFSVVLQVNSGTPSGTSVTDTVTATAANAVPSITTNTASATVIVANANSADVAIVKTGSPNPVTEGTPLTYSLAVTNNGPASATNVTVTDTLPSVVTYLSANTTQGSCSEAGGTVTCLLGTMTNAGTATITIVTLPNAPGVVSNTATVAADQTDPVPANNSSTQTETITFPTGITLQSFSAYSGADKNGANRTVLMWKTGGEAHNLGFNVYREQNGNRVRVNPSMIAGSALLMSGALPRHSGRSYEWIDPSAAVAGASYWLEDIDVNGTRIMHGPVSVAGGARPAGDAAAETRMFSQLNQAQPAAPGGQGSHFVETLPLVGPPTIRQVQKQFDLAAHPAVKILVQHEGWQRITQPDLVRAGLDPNADPSHLHLYAEAIEQPLQITGATAGPGGFGSQAAINFYGTGIDTVFSGTRVYWLAVGDNAGLGIPVLPASAGSNQAPASFPATVELKQHSTYFAALSTSNGDNFFGAFVSPAPVDQVLDTPHLDSNSTQPARFEVALQGVIVGFPHDVKVSLNGNAVGDVTFIGQAKGTLIVNLPPGTLLEGNNTVTLTAQNGDYDTSLVESIRITYPHLYVADFDKLKFTGRAGDEIRVRGFVSVPTVIDITDLDRPVQLTPQVSPVNGRNEIAVQVPWTTTNTTASARHTLLAVADDRFLSAAGIRHNHPSQWHSAQAGADIAMVTFDEFAAALAPLVQAHRSEGKSSAVVRISDLYDEFNFGERSPFAIKKFLQAAKANWKTPPTYLLLNGRASLDPRNYLGLGHLDLVPTRILSTSSLMTASDDWFSDFTGSGMPTIATGRLPVGTIDEATTVIGKIVAYEGNSTNGAWTSNALMVADKDDIENFTQDSQTVQAQLPASMQVTNVFAGMAGAATHDDIVTAINSGQLLVNYLGHGSEDQWAGSNIFDSSSVSSLTNGSQLPVFLIMDCLNGFFQDVYAQPLGTTLLLAPNGGGVAVLASSGLNQPTPQTSLDTFIVQNALSSKTTLGQSILKAKSNISDPDVRRTFVLFGDPAMQVKQPSAALKTK
jgi:uncharacterized repeat protein (TIGR01451 family)